MSKASDFIVNLIGFDTAMGLAAAFGGEVVQSWEDEETRIEFNDGSRVRFSGPEVIIDAGGCEL